MVNITLPTKTRKGLIEKVKLMPNLIIGTTIGLVKDVNEDRVGCTLNNNSLRICVADGHWGETAAKIVVNHWIKEGEVFPANQKDSVLEVIKIEQELFRMFGKIGMDPNLDFTPEASFIAIQLINRTLRIISYGDCRLLIARKGVIKMKLKTRETWLGAFSRLGLRNRVSVRDGLVFEETTLLRNDSVLIFTDGIDQCVYEQDTLSNEFFANLTNKGIAENTFDCIFNAVFVAGAEDNASLVVIKPT
jgi:serine/threonine protein phosphatase PrpC